MISRWRYMDIPQSVLSVIHLQSNPTIIWSTAGCLPRYRERLSKIGIPIIQIKRSSHLAIFVIRIQTASRWLYNGSIRGLIWWNNVWYHNDRVLFITKFNTTDIRTTCHSAQLWTCSTTRKISNDVRLVVICCILLSVATPSLLFT